MPSSFSIIPRANKYPPRVLAAIIAGAGLSVAGLIMQTNLNNAMTSPSTLGVSNAAVFGANLYAFCGGERPLVR